MPRAVWKGAITFGLVHVPVSLYPGSRPNQLDFTLLDRRDLAPVGYQRINKRSGKPVAWEDIVKGYEYEDDQYVVMGEEDFKQANPKATQTVDIVAFVEQADVPPYFYDTPYYLEPGKRGEKAYALLREALERSGKIGIANVVIRTRQHLAAVIPVGAVLVLDTLRFADEILPGDALALPDASAARAGVGEKELTMARRLVEDMSEPWRPERYHDSYREDLLRRIEEKIAARQTHVIAQPSKGRRAPRSAEVIDLVAVLKKSLETRGEDSKRLRARGNGEAGRRTSSAGGERQDARERARGKAREARGRAPATGATRSRPTARTRRAH